MAVILESANTRQRSSFDFETHYCNLCALQDTVPLIEVKAHLRQGVLDINCDKIRLADWPPILNTLRINKSLRFIAVRSFYVQSVDKDGNIKKTHYFKRRPPAIRSKDLTLRVAQAIAECLKKTENLKCLDLQGIPFRDRDLAAIAKGIDHNSTLTHVSMEYCPMGDKGCEEIVESLKHHSCLTHLNLTGCSLTWKSAEFVSKLIKYQSTERHSEAWVDSLRYRRPNLDSMTGLRRITLNCNPMIGDEGALVLAEALKDDLWLKGMDLQKCGIGREGADSLIETLNQNKTLVVLDVRFNPLIDRNLLHTLIGQVLINSNGYDEAEFPWIVAKPPKDPYHTKPKKKYKQIGSGYGRKTSVKTGARPSSRNRHLQPSISHASPGATGFVPWRTAYRASQYKMIYDDKECIGTPRYLQNAEVGEVTIQVEEDSTSNGGDLSPSPMSPPRHSRPESTLVFPSSPVTVAIKSYDDKIRELKIDLLEARRTVAEERKARHIAEQHAMNLEVENIRLKRELEEEREVNGVRSALDDEVLLESIENSFTKFHDFLDLLKQLGLGGLVAYAGMSDMQFPLNNTDKRPKVGLVKDTRISPHGSDQEDQQSEGKSLRKEAPRPLQKHTTSKEVEVVATPPPLTIHGQAKEKKGSEQEPADPEKITSHREGQLELAHGDASSIGIFKSKRPIANRGEGRGSGDG